jgi:S-adenosylmethionine-diacylglycerol 3-amino-3-carboxypropyl transferase
MNAGGGARALGRGLLYAQCWEDPVVAREALRIPAGGTVVAIAAAGDNVLALLTDDPARIVAVDVNAAQVALLQLKVAAIRTLPEAGRVAAFLGAAPAGDRVQTYRRVVRPALPGSARGHWDAHLADIEDGVIHTGRFERYLSVFRRRILPLVPGRDTVRAMLRVTNLDDQRRIYRERWDSWRWRLLFRLFFSRSLLRRFGRDPAFFENSEIDDIGAHYLARAEHALVDIPIWSNPYVAYILTGGFGTTDQMPDYLRPDMQEIIRARLDRIEVRTAGIDETLRALPDGSVDAFYLSDIFELSTSGEHAATLAEVARTGRPGARVCYWNNLVPRQRPVALDGRLSSEGTEAGRLHAVDRAFLYSTFVVEAVRGGGG